MNKITILAASLAVIVSAFAPVSAQTAAAVARFSTAESNIGDLLANPATKAIVDKHIPGLSENASINMASGMTLRAIQPMAGDSITEKMLNDIDADLAKLPAK